MLDRQNDDDPGAKRTDVAALGLNRRAPIRQPPLEGRVEPTPRTFHRMVSHLIRGS
jgi:hypothetical protein